MTNFEKIKSLNIEEMGDFIFDLITACERTKFCEECKYNKLNICMSNSKTKEWLESEVSES